MVVCGLAISVLPMRLAAAQVVPVTVNLCDATTINLNPYTYTTVTIDSLETAQTVGGYASKTGPIYDAHAPQTSWGDIIPPFTYGQFSFAGYNWTTTGKQVFHGHNPGHPNGCVDDLEWPPTPSPTPTPSPSPSPSHHRTPPPSSDAPSVGGIGGGTAFTGGNFTGTFVAVLAFVLVGMGILLFARKQSGLREEALGSPRDLY
jgi:hypothetical protein